MEIVGHLHALHLLQEFYLARRHETRLPVEAAKDTPMLHLLIVRGPYW